MKVDIQGASAFVNRMFDACMPFQWAREFLKNSLEAKATKVEFGIEWQAVERLGFYRRTIADNGTGMDADELLHFFSTLGVGNKKIGGIHDNFGVGAKIASLPWNPNGVVVISYKNGKASMICIMLEPESDEYELVEFAIGDTRNCVIDPSEIDWRLQEGGVNWNLVRPAWVEDHGTVIVLMGSDEHPDTVLGNPNAGEGSIKGLSVFLNSRFWELSGVEVKVAELNSDKKNVWPLSPQDPDTKRRPNNRTILGAKYYLTDVKADKGTLLDSGLVLLEDERVSVEWYLWKGERPRIETYAKRSGYIAVRYNDELFHYTTGTKSFFRWFGVIESAVQQNLTLVIEPQLFRKAEGRWGVHPDQSRSHLRFTGNGEKAAEVPLSEWGLAFSEAMPDAIQAAIREARGDVTATLDDEEYRKRLQDKFGNRWTVKTFVKAKKRPGKDDGPTVTVSNEDVEVTAEPSDVPDIVPVGGVVGPRKRKKTLVLLRKRAVLGGTDAGAEVDSPVDVPKIRFGKKEDYNEPWHLALWAPHDIGGPAVYINQESPILEEIIQYHSERYPDAHAEIVRQTVLQVFGEVAACKVAHTQKLRQTIPEEVLDKEYRNEKALTLALMGLMAEESLIAARLGFLGKKKATA